MMKEMKEYTITKTLFKMRKKTHTTENYIMEGLEQFSFGVRFVRWT